MAVPQIPGMFGPVGPPGGNLFMNMVAQQGGSPMFSGYNASGGRPAGMIPQLGAFNLFTQGPIHRMFAGMGLVPGQFAGTQNLYDQYKQQQRFSDQFAAIRAGAQRDVPTMTDTIVGAGRMLGIPMGATQQGTAAGMAQSLTAITPWMAQMAPDLLDKLHGSRGSAAVLARGLSMGGRYAIDPVTRLHESSVDTIEEISKSIERGVDDPQSDLNRFGVSRGQAGLMYEELSERGLLGTRSIGLQTRQQRMQSLADADPDMDLPDIENLGDEALNTKLRQFDASSVKRRLEGLSGSVDAMREIFGDMGNPNAPMSQIIDGLNALTQGGLASMSSSELERMVRNTKSVAQISGVGMDAMMALTAQAGKVGDQLGLHRSLAPVAAQQGALAGRASADQGWAGTFGAARPEEVMVAVTKAREQGFASRFGQGLGSFMRAREELTDKGEFKAGSRAERLHQALQRGDDTFEGQDMSVLLDNRAAMREILADDSGLNDNSVNQWGTFLNDPFGNQQYLSESPEAASIIGMAQSQEAGNTIMAPAVGISLQRNLRVLGESDPAFKDQNRQNEIVQKVAHPLSQNIWRKATAEDMKDGASWRAFVDREARPMLEAEGLSDEQIDKIMPALASGIKTEGHRQAQEEGYQNLQQTVQMFGGQAAKQQQRNNLIATQDAEVASALAPLKAREPIRRFMDILQEGDQPISEAVGKFLGGVPAEDFKEPLQDAFDAMHTARQRLDEAETDEERTNAQEELRVAERRVDTLRAAAPDEDAKIRRVQDFASGKNEVTVGDVVGGLVEGEELQDVVEVAFDEMQIARDQLKAAKTPEERAAAQARLDAARTRVEEIIPDLPQEARAKISEAMAAIADPDSDVVKSVVDIALGDVEDPKLREGLVEALEEQQRHKDTLKELEDPEGRYYEDGQLTAEGRDVRQKALEGLRGSASRINTISEAFGDRFAATAVDSERISAAEGQVGAIADRLIPKLDEFGEETGEFAYQKAASPRARARVQRQYEAGSKSVAGLANQFYGDENSMRRLGEGGLDLIESLEADQLEFDRLVRESGGDADALLSGGGSTEKLRGLVKKAGVESVDELMQLSDAQLTALGTSKEKLEALKGRSTDAETARSLYAKIGEQTREVDRRFNDKDTSGMTAEERKRFKEKLTDFRAGEEHRRKDVAKTIAEMAGMDPDNLQEEELNDLMAQIGKGSSLREIEVAAESAEKLKDLVGEAGLQSVDDLSELDDAHLEELGTSREEIEELRGHAGALADLGEGEFQGVTGAEAALDEMGRDDDFVAAQEGEEGEFGPLLKGLERLLGNIKIDVAKLLIEGEGGKWVPANGADDTPVPSD